MRGEEIKKILEKDGYQLTDIAEKLNISPQNLNNWLHVQDIKTGILEKIAKAINKSVYYFINNSSIDNSENEGIKKGDIKYYEIDVSAGFTEMFESDSKDSFKKIQIPGFEDCKFAFNTWGDSMEPIIHNGEIILCKEWNESFIEFGHIYLIITKENNRMIKYIHPGNDESKISCASENKYYKPFEILKADILKLFRVKGHIGRNAI